MDERIIFHIDVNSAYVAFSAVEMLVRGKTEIDIRTVPSIIGGDRESRCGIVLAASIPAKDKGIKTGETIYSALQKCPELLIYPPDFDVYVKCNKALIELLKEYSPLVEVFSIDEAFVDVSHLKDNYMENATEIKKRIKNEIGFNVNIGVSSCKLLSKVASDFKPKDSIHTLFPNEIKKKMWGKPVSDLFGVGKATLPKLNKLNIFTIGDLAKYDVNILKQHLKSHGVLIHRYANGIDSSSVKSGIDINIRGIGNSTTLKRDVNEKEYILKMLLALTESVAMRLRDSAGICGVVAVSIKTNDFFRYSHQKQLELETDCTAVIYKGIKETFIEMWRGEYIRQIGIRVTNITSNQFYQTTLFDDENTDKNRSIDNVIDGLRKRYGKGCIKRSTFLVGDIKGMEGGTTEDYSPKISSLL